MRETSPTKAMLTTRNPNRFNQSIHAYSTLIAVAAVHLTRPTQREKVLLSGGQSGWRKGSATPLTFFLGMHPEGTHTTPLRNVELFNDFIAERNIGVIYFEEDETGMHTYMHCK